MPELRVAAAAAQWGLHLPRALARDVLEPLGPARSPGERSHPAGPDAIQPPPMSVAMSGRGLRTTESANAAAGAGENPE